MMEWVLLLAVSIWFIIFIRGRYASFKFSLAPKEIEIKPIKGLKKLSDHLEQTLSEKFMDNVKNRVEQNNKLMENEYEWRLLDLKRYFILALLLKESPMFSVKVDELWHEMLMFTREYDDFSKGYLGSPLHHSPNVERVPAPDLRGFFDWVYSELFFIRQENVFLYQGFFKYPVNPELIEEFRKLPENELIDRYFKHSPKYQATVMAIVSSMKKTALKLKNYEKKIIQEMMKKSKEQKNYNAMIVPFLSVSYFHYDEFSSYMKISSSNSSNCTSCGFGDSCSSNCSNSSCSSCGGGGD